MPDYTYADVTLASTFPVRELNLVRDDTLRGCPAFAVRLLDGPPAEPMGTGWRHHWYSDVGDLTLSLATSGDGFLLRFPGLADFVVSTDARRIAAWPGPGTNRETLRHLLLDQVLPRMLGHVGRLVLHASSVEVDGRAIAFAGETGRGKSTLAASLHACGCPLLGDDGLIVTACDDHTIAIPTYCGLRLWPPSVAPTVDRTLSQAPSAQDSDKRRLELPAKSGSEPMPLAALYVLAPPPDDNEAEIGVTRFSGRDACIELIRHAFQLDVGDRERAARLLATASEVAERLPVFGLKYPRDYGFLPAVRSTILDRRESWAGVARDIGQEG